MSEVEHELSQDDSVVEITPLPKEGSAHEEQDSSESTINVGGKKKHPGMKRYLLIALTLCLVIAFFLVTVGLPRTQSPELIAQPSSHGTAVLLNATAIPSNAPTDYRVYTTIVNSEAYAVAASGGVYALNASNGNLLWHHKIDPGSSSAPLLSNGIVYIVANRSDAGPGTLYALRASDGMELWQYTTSNSLSGPLLGSDRVFVTSYDDVSQIGNLLAFSAGDGVQLWHKKASGFSYNTPFVDHQIVYMNANADNGSSSVYALRASDGTQLWQKTTSTFTLVSLATNGIAYLLSDRELSAVSASNGQLLWKVPIEGYSGLPPQVVNGVLYLTTTNAPLNQTVPSKQGLSSVYAVRISDGAVLWHYSLNNENGNNWANWLSIQDGTVYVGSNVDQETSYLYALRSDDGSLLWRQAMVKGMSVNAVVAGGVVYIASFINDGSTNAGSGAVYALRANNGAQLWHHSMYWVVYNPPILAGTTIYVSTASEDLYAFQASNGSLLWHFHADEHSIT